VITMNEADALRTEAAALPHAIARSITIFPDGHMGEETELHYLSCRKCELERLADEAERETTR